jgi:hypothetical protein
MLGSVIDKHDFVGFDEARRLEPHAEDQRLRDMVKWFSPERAQDPAAVEGSIFLPHSPAGRLLLMRSEALAKVGAGDDGVLNEKFIAAGYETGIATAVRHRHLSLLHVYDYPEYDYDRRDAYCQRPDSEAGAPPPAACP